MNYTCSLISTVFIIIVHCPLLNKKYCLCSLGGGSDEQHECSGHRHLLNLPELLCEHLVVGNIPDT